MRAIVRHRYGPPGVLELQEVEQPEVAPGAVLVRVRAASVNAYEWHVMRGLPYVFGSRPGAFADLVSGRNFVPKPTNLTFEEAAAVPVAGTTALQALRDRGHLEAGQTVLVTGAGGGVGVRSRLGHDRLVPFLARVTRDDLLGLRKLIEDGQVRPVIDRTYPLAATADAIRRVEEGRAAGKVVITV